jgi:hypothetical protein
VPANLGSGRYPGEEDPAGVYPEQDFRFVAEQGAGVGIESQVWPLGQFEFEVQVALEVVHLLMLVEDPGTLWSIVDSPSVRNRTNVFVQGTYVFTGGL